MFKNISPLDFTIESERTKLSDALRELDQELSTGPKIASPVIGGTSYTTDETFTRLDPSNPSIEVGKISFATQAHVTEALEILKRAAPLWREAAVAERAAILERAASLMAERRRALAALIIREAGKPWREADADVAEAIDFCRYYAAEAVRVFGAPKKTMEIPGEENWYLYEPRGIAAVISPWNFPFAIACGMTVAALVTGNVVAFKPAEQTSIIAHTLASILFEAGLPRNVLAFLPGWGETIGRALVQSPDVALICFTGSRAVGLEIAKEASTVRPGQHHLKRVILELGGKNAFVVDEDSDLDEAIRGVLYSAFGYAGQKCSACSRVLVVGDAYETFLARAIEAARALIIGAASDSSSYLGPVVDEESQKRIFKTIETAEQTTPLAFKGTAPTMGYFVPPVIFRDVSPNSSLWRDEIFGPVLAVRRVETFEEGVAEALASEYALTGGVYSRSPKNIEYAKRKFTVGNLYINRGCTGALVCRQPFGGFKMSGIGSKAGGPDYLLQFVEPRTYTENTMRRGFTPETK